jgi:hypothetical protein
MWAMSQCPSGQTSIGQVLLAEILMVNLFIDIFTNFNHQRMKESGMASEGGISLILSSFFFFFYYRPTMQPGIINCASRAYHETHGKFPT